VTDPSTDAALIAARSETCPPSAGIEDVVDALGYGVLETVCQERREHNRYNLGPGLVDRLADRIDAAGVEYLAVDHLVHPGQMVDLTATLPPVTLRDRRGVFREYLAADNPVAALLSTRQAKRIERRAVARDQRDGAAATPEGTGRRLAALDRELDRLDGRIEERAADRRTRLAETHAADSYVAVTGPPTAAIGPTWRTLTDEPLDAAGVLGPSEPTTARVSIGCHDVAVTATTAILGDLPTWYERTVPGTVAALSRADIVVSVLPAGDSWLATVETITDRFDGTHIAVAEQSAAVADPAAETVTREDDALVDRIEALLPSERLRVSLPQTDESMTLVSWCYDNGRVVEIAYGETVALTLEVPPGLVDELRSRVSSVGGRVERKK
jgi:GTP-binding protein HflX